VTGGIAQGDTLIVKNTLPSNAKVFETVSVGNIPQDAMAIYGLTDREFLQASLSNELKLGSLPPKQVKATEVVELTQSQAITLDSINSDIEDELITKVLRKAWLLIIQNGDVLNAIGTRAAFALSQTSPAERYVLFADKCSFKVHGLSAVMSKMRDFQKMMAMLQGVSQNPLLFQAFFKMISPGKVLSHLFKSLSINPEDLKKDEEEMGRIQQDFQEMQQLQGLIGGAQGGGPSAEETGEPGLPAEINQATNPLTGAV